jgi:hypothetical protein
MRFQREELREGGSKGWEKLDQINCDREQNNLHRRRGRGGDVNARLGAAGIFAIVKTHVGFVENRCETGARPVLKLASALTKLGQGCSEVIHEAAQ